MTQHMAKNRVGTTDVQVTSLGLGAASLGNLYKAVDDDEARRTMNCAMCSGINLYDTSPRYGLGLSERRVGDALRSFDKSDYVLSTKVGRLLKADRHADISVHRYDFDTPMPFDAHYDYSYDGIMRSYEDSMQRLGLAEIDILLVHDIGEFTHGFKKNQHYYNQLRSGGFKALEALRQQKLIKAVGLGVNETAICETVMELGQFDCFLLAGRYTLLEQNAIDSFLPKCIEHGASVILGGPYNSGILATGTRKSKTLTYDYLPAPSRIVSRVKTIENICDKYGVTLAAAALQFPLAHQAVATVIPGIGSAHRVTKTIELLREVIPDEFWSELKAQNLIKKRAPTPKTHSAQEG